MADENPSIISHVSLGTDDFPAARQFYVKVLETLGCRIIMEHEGAAAFGKAYPEFWIQTPFDGAKASCGNGVHFGFGAIQSRSGGVFQSGDCRRSNGRRRPRPPP